MDYQLVPCCVLQSFQIVFEGVTSIPSFICTLALKQKGLFLFSHTRSLFGSILSDVGEKSPASFLMQNNRKDTLISFRIKSTKTNQKGKSR
ncbi:hypothetical protein ACWOCD_10150, partial [Enterococcus silesiacus]